MKLLTIVICIFVLTKTDAQSMHNPFYCFSSDPVRSQDSWFATQSGYEAARGRRIDSMASTCAPSRFWIVARHAERNPHVEEINLMRDLASSSVRENILRNRDLGRTTLCEQDVVNLRQWELNANFTEQADSLLTVAGWNTMIGIAQRYQAAFPTLLPNVFNQTTFRFRHTHTQRSIASVQAFADGLFGSNAFENVVYDDVPERDTLLRPHNFCPAYETINNITTEQDAFMEGPEFEQMLDQVNAKLGFTGSNQLNSGQIRTIWDWCRYGRGSETHQPAAWCAAFSIANHQVLDFYEDLNYYYNMGYGVQDRRLAENLNCELMQNLLNALQSQSSTQGRLRIFGAHTATIQLFLVTMGVLEDEFPPTRHNFAQQLLRHWRTGIISPKASNIAMIRFDCPDGDNDALFLLNEKPLRIPGCQENGLCKVSWIVERFSRFLNVNCENVFCTSS